MARIQARWRGERECKQRRKGLGTCAAMSVWMTLWECNKRSFQGVKERIQQLTSRFLGILLSWVLGIWDLSRLSLDSLADI